MWAAIFIIVLALIMVLAAPKPNIENARAAKLGDFQFPRSREGDPVAWFLGTVRLKSPNSLWYGDFKPVAITKKQKTGLFSSKRVTVGFKYYIGLDLCFALGPDVELLRLWAGKYDIWQGSLTTESTININLPELFGGEEQRGGLVGYIDYYPGSFTQGRNSYLASKADADVPAYVGQTHLVFRGQTGYIDGPWGIQIPFGVSGFYFGTQTGVEPISAEMRRLAYNIDPVFSVMPNGFDVNPMELLYVALTQRWAMLGVSAEDIDLPSWKRDAETLYNENMGMSLLVQQAITGKDIAEEVLRIADGILYQDPTTGKIVSKLIRNDYVIADLPVLDQSIVKELRSFNKTTWDGTYNQCRVTIKDRSNLYAEKVATAQDFALINYQQRVRNTDISVPGCFDAVQAGKLAARQLSMLSVPLFSIEIACNRRASTLKPGDVFVFNWAPYGLTNMVMRVQKVDLGTLTDGTVTVNAVQDRFGAAVVTFAPPADTGWTPVNTGALPVVNREFFETPYWFRQFFTTPPADTLAVPYALAAPPSSSSVNFNVETAPAADFVDVTESPGYTYHGSVVLTTPFALDDGRATGYSASGFTVELVDVPSSLLDFNGTFPSIGQFMLLLNDELLAPANITDNGNGTYTFSQVYRALLDTAFADHAIGARAYIIWQDDGLLPVAVSDTSTLHARIRDVTPAATLSPESALTDSIAMNRRAYRPAPPRYTTINGSRTPADALGGGDLALAWRSRNRKTLSLVKYDAGTEAAEAATDYGWRYRVDGGAWSGFTYTANLSATLADAPVGVVDVEVWSRRDGVLSYTGDSCTIKILPETFYILTEEGDRIVTEEGNPLIQE